MFCPLVLLSNFIDDCGNITSRADLTKLISSEELFKLLQNIRIPITGLPEQVIIGAEGSKIIISVVSSHTRSTEFFEGHQY